MTIEYLSDIIILLAAAVIAVPLFQSLGLGAITGFVVAGIAVGPSGLGYIENVEDIAHLAELGVVLLLFVIGIELKPARLWQMRRYVFGLGSLQILITGVLLTFAMHYGFAIAWDVSLMIGMALSLSSTAFVLQVLSERRQISTEHGRPAVSILLMQDLAVVPLLALVTLLEKPDMTMAEDVFYALGEAVTILGGIIVFGRYILNPLLNFLTRSGAPEVFTASTLLLVLVAALAMERIGLSMATGAFLAGLIVADSTYRHQILAEIHPFRGLLLGLFFMSMGMSLNLQVFLAAPLNFLGLVLILLPVKFLVLWPLTRAFRVRGRAAMAVSILLAQSGEFALVLFALAHNLGILQPDLFQQLLVVVLLSMLSTPLLDKLAQKVLSRREPEPVAETPKPEVRERAHIILAGFGRVGHRIGQILEMSNIPYVAIDKNPSRVQYKRNEGHKVYYGDARRPEVFRAAGIEEAALVIVTLDDFEATEHVVATLHAVFPTVPVFARGHDIERCQELIRIGARYTVSENLEASAELAKAVLKHIGTEEDKVRTVLEQFRKSYYDKINKVL
ncbi:monovalent cation:proton antiporter-2 (CPA2) family protein [Luteithermobacter gelatinilyticus]|uniref:monovalent cation:proton antiporter-2 (CPA2) family protein n=1 Tax=Luteithermobacter gelatinilyticus TaxID=2582913 RepID=UPI00143DF8A4|nr:monovalent cation:proton antiporter-2 (CPA2) family protein [Luteithermobacter gelatinilyticus]